MNISNLSVGPSERRVHHASQIRNRFALSEKRCQGFCKGVFWTVWLDVALMLPAIICVPIPARLDSSVLPRATIAHGICYYGLLGIAFMAVMYVIAVFQYQAPTLAFTTKVPTGVSRWPKSSGNSRSRSSEKRTCPT